MDSWGFPMIPLGWEFSDMPEMAANESWVCVGAVATNGAKNAPLDLKLWAPEVSGNSPGFPKIPQNIPKILNFFNILFQKWGEFLSYFGQKVSDSSEVKKTVYLTFPMDWHK